jgi:hypothetical protein
LLFEKADPRTRMEPDVPIVRRIQTGEYSEKRCLASAVRPYQAYAFSGTELEADVTKHKRIERSRQFGTAKKQHKRKAKTAILDMAT